MYYFCKQHPAPTFVALPKEHLSHEELLRDPRKENQNHLMIGHGSPPWHIDLRYHWKVHRDLNHGMGKYIFYLQTHGQMGLQCKYVRLTVCSVLLLFSLSFLLHIENN